MTVKDAVKVLKSAKEIRLCWGNGSIPGFRPDDPLPLDAFGKYVVDEIMAISVEPEAYEITVAMRPVKEGE